jgi:hypothetical protein
MLALAAPLAKEPGCLATLTGPSWYHQDSGPVYTIGGAFVNFLIRQNGTKRFIEFYYACRSGSFNANCQSVYGVDADELEGQFWADTKRLATAPKTR